MWSQFMKSPSKTSSKGKKSASARTPKKPASPDWRAQTLDRIRELIQAADPQIVEERKWRKASNPAGVPVFSREGIVCTGETYKEAVKITFANGASLSDPKKLFNSSLEGNLRRAIDIREGESVDPAAFKVLIKAAVARNRAAKDK
jgi:hypothetical protein